MVLKNTNEEINQNISASTSGLSRANPTKQGVAGEGVNEKHGNLH